MGGEVRYCTAEDGVRIAYKVEGEGPPLVVLPSLVEAYCSIEHRVPQIFGGLRRLGAGRLRIFIDMRGTGLSQRDVPDMSLDSLQLDVKAVVDALGFERVSLWGSVAGGVRAMGYAAQHPHRVDRMVLHTTFAKLVEVFPAETYRGIANLARTNWPIAAKTLADLGARREDEDTGLLAAQNFEESTTGEVLAKLFEDNLDLDLTPRLPQIQAPTLILHPVKDPLYPLAMAQRLASGIPGSRIVTLGNTAHAFFQMPDEIVEGVNRFFNEGLEAAQPARVENQGPFRTVLLTDIVGHTAMMQRLGDAKGRAVLREHERITREVLKANGGTEVKTMGDGFMASFGSVTKAVECAIALQRAFVERNESAAQPLSIRVGLNAGEPIEEEGDLFGATVILAARIAAQADGSEILASLAVRELCAGKGFLFADRGEHVLRGFEDPVRMFEIRWRE